MNEDEKAVVGLANSSQIPSVSVTPAVLASKRVVYIGGLAEEATSQLVRAALIPFGSIKSVDMVRYRCYITYFRMSICLSMLSHSLVPGKTKI
jgi:RNA recognition motif-containing protein